MRANIHPRSGKLDPFAGYLQRWEGMNCIPLLVCVTDEVIVAREDVFFLTKGGCGEGLPSAHFLLGE